MIDAGLRPSWMTRAMTATSEMAIAAIVGLLFLWMGADGSAWILGGIVAGAIVVLFQRICLNLHPEPNRTARQIGQVLVGLTVGFSVQQSHIFAVSTYIPLFAFLTLCLVLSGILVALLYARLEETDILTALLATTPGNIGVMASIAADYGRNPSLVALVQLMRFTAVTSVIPLLTHATQKPAFTRMLSTLAAQITDLSFNNLAWLSLALLLSSFSVYIGQILKLPVPTLLCPLIVGMSFNASFTAIPFLPSADFTPPTLLNLIGQILLGMTIGEYWGINPALSRVAIARGSFPVAFMLTAGFLVAGLAKIITHWDWITCLLVTAPGGSPEMIWIALALNQNVEIVTTGHLVRLIILNGLLPFMITGALFLQNKSATSPKTPTA